MYIIDNVKYKNIRALQKSMRFRLLLKQRLVAEEQFTLRPIEKGLFWKGTEIRSVEARDILKRAREYIKAKNHGVG